MTEPQQDGQGLVTGDVELSAADWQLRFRASVPAGPTPWRQMLPLVQAMTDAVVTGTSRALDEQGHPISCGAGCGACCRQLVPISEVEAQHLRDLVHSLPQPRRSQVLSRFAQAHQRLDEAGLLQPLRHYEAHTDAEFVPLGMAYFRLGISCPFLEDESCSIYPDRPITCREFLVTSPAENCTQPTPETVERVNLPLRMVTALARFVPGDPPQFRLPVPLILAVEWADQHPSDPPPRTGPEWLREILDRVRVHSGGNQESGPR
jgi:Fe-S-cluster containining protein